MDARRNFCKRRESPKNASHMNKNRLTHKEKSNIIKHGEKSPYERINVSQGSPIGHRTMIVKGPPK